MLKPKLKSFTIKQIKKAHYDYYASEDIYFEDAPAHSKERKEIIDTNWNGIRKILEINNA